MFIEMHIIQNFAPANLNRDDTGSPKDCIFGGFRRARVSSQCLKRAIRTRFATHDQIGPADLAVRSKRMLDRLIERLKESPGFDEATARAVVTAALAGLEIKLADEGKTEYLLYLAESELEALAGVCRKHREALLGAFAAMKGGADSAGVGGEQSEQAAVAAKGGGRGAGKGGKEAKKKAKEAVPKEVQAELQKVFRGNTAVDLALFGRMLADRPADNVNAACQVAHAISTHEVAMEMDFYTAVDDLRPGDTQGADMMGVVEFTSACFYRFMVVDWDALVRNLGGDAALAKRALRVFLDASIDAIPTGKQNSMAAHNPPSYLRAVVRKDGNPWNLCNAFSRPIRASRDDTQDLAALSIGALERHAGELKAAYGSNGEVKVLRLQVGAAAEGFTDRQGLVDGVLAALDEHPREG